MCLQYKSFENTVGKKKLLVTSNFSFSHGVFYPFGEFFCNFHQIQNWRLQTLSSWKSLKCVVCERVKPKSRVTVLYAEHVKEPGGAHSSFVLYPCTFPRNNYPPSGGRRSDGQPVATINKRK